MPENHWIIMPIEVQRRELDAKLVVAAIAVSRGYKVLVGQDRIIRRLARFLPKGILFDKSIGGKGERKVYRYNSLGYQIAAMDEEATGFLVTPELFMETRMAPDTLALTRRWFCISDTVREMCVDKYPKFAETFVTTGLGRTDTWQKPLVEMYRDDAEKFRNRLGRFILFNSNFGVPNHARGEHFVAKQLSRVESMYDAELTGFGQLLRENKANLEALRLRLAELPKVQQAQLDLLESDLQALYAGQPVRGALNRAFAEGLGANHKAPAIILDGTGKNLRGGGTHSVDQHHQRPVIGNGWVLVVEYLYVVVGVANLYRGAFLDEQADQVVGFMKCAAAVIAEVHHHAIDAICLQLVDQFANIPGGALVVGIAILHRLEVGVEGGNVNDADAVSGIAAFELDDFLAGALFLQLHFVPLNGDGFSDGFIRGIGGNDFQGHRGFAGAANQIHNLVEAPADDVDGLFLVVLFDRHDTVCRLKLALL